MWKSHIGLLTACVAGMLGSSNVAAQSLIFPNTPINDIVFSGLELFAQPSARKGRAGDVEYNLRCIATSSQPDIEKAFELIFLVYSKDNRVLRSVGTGPITLNKNVSATCGQGTGPFQNPGAPPDHIALEVKVTMAKAHRRLELTSVAMPNLTFNDMMIDDLTFSNLSLAAIPITSPDKVPLAAYQVTCVVKGKPGTVRTITEPVFYAYAAADSSPFVAIPIGGGPITTANGKSGDCHDGTGPILDAGLVPVGMALQYTEVLPLTRNSVLVRPVAK
jgi:hypothetical protein